MLTYILDRSRFCVMVKKDGMSKIYLPLWGKGDWSNYFVYSVAVFGAGKGILFSKSNRSNITSDTKVSFGICYNLLVNLFIE